MATAEPMPASSPQPVVDPAGTAGHDHLPGPPQLTEAARLLSDGSRIAFRLANRWLMIPLHRAGLAAWLNSPLSGWQCLVTTVGRKSGQPRPVPLGYLVRDGAVWVLAGYGPHTAWLRNVEERPRVQLRLPGRRPMSAIARQTDDPVLRARIIPPLCRSMALPGSMIGCFPPTSSDARILECVSWVPLVRIAAADGEPIVAGPDDPGGRGWMWRQALAVGLTVVVAVLLRAIVSRR